MRIKNLCGNVFITADLHYDHSNIASKNCSRWKSGYRSFDSLSDMNHHIISHTNDIVKRKDTLILDGDSAFGERGVRELRRSLNCQNIIVINGNHDNDYLNRQLFSTVCDYGTLKFGGTEVILFHHPIRSWDRMGHGSVHLYGHIHSVPRDEYGRSMDIGFDGSNYKIYSLDEAVKYLLSKPILKEGHHV